MPKLNGARVFLKSLEQEKVKTIFGYPGGVLLPLYDVMPEFKSINHVLVRNEQGAALAADGYARIKNDVGVCLSTSGPGATNLLTGIANAFMDSVPIVAITGQVATNMIGSDAFQEVDITGLTMPITKHNYLVEKAEDIPRIIKEAFHIARTGRPGPVHIDIPVDVFKAEVKDFQYPKEVHLPGYKPTFKGSGYMIKKAAELIKHAKKPVILAGHGVIIAKASQNLVELAEKTNTPVFTTLLGIGGYPETHHLAYGMLGMHGMAHANYAVHNADLLIGIGLRFDDRITGRIEDFARGAKVIHIDIDPAEIGKNRIVDVPIVGDVKLVLQELNKLIAKKRHKEWIEKINLWCEDNPVACKPTNLVPKNGELLAQHVINQIYQQTKGDSIVVADVGQNEMFTAQHYFFDKPQKLLASGGLGTMGYSLPAAIGARMASPEKETVWAIMGDGGFQMNMQELMTVRQENLNLKIAILDNTYLGMIRQWQELFFKKNYVYSKILNPDFVKIAEANGIEAYRAKDFKETKQTIKKAMSKKGPVLIDFVVEPEENVFPMVPPNATLEETMVSKAGLSKR